MGVAAGAIDLGAHHAVAHIRLGGDRISAGPIPKLGQPVPESNLVAELKSGAPQQTQWYMPVALLSQ